MMSPLTTDNQATQLLRTVTRLFGRPVRRRSTSRYNSVANSGEVQLLEQREMLTANLVPEEQLLLELVNRARANPDAEAARLNIDLNQGLPENTISSDPKQPLAPNDLLSLASADHTTDMLDRDFFAHTSPSPNSTTFSQRATNVGYPWSRIGENLALQTYLLPLDAEHVTRQMHDGLFLSSGHRKNLMNNDFFEVGIGVDFGPWTDNANQLGGGAGVTYNAGVTTEMFGKQAQRPFITGVVFTDANDNSADDDNFYSVGEGAGSGATITATNVTSGATFTAAVGLSGGYSLAVSAGTYNVTATGGTLGTGFQVSNVVIGTENVKVDFETTTATPAPDPELSLSIVAASISENGGTTTATVTRTGGDHSVELTVTLSSSDTSEATVPQTVTIPANAQSVSFTITAVDDTEVDGTQTVTISASAAQHTADEDSLDVTNDDVPPIQIIDNGDAGHSWTGFIPYSDGSGHEGDYGYAGPGNGSATSTWTFTVVPGRYRISTTWTAHANRATDAPYMIFDDGALVTENGLNQELVPNDRTDSGTDWEDVATVDIVGTELKVTLSNLANQFVIADAVRIELNPTETVQIIDDGDAGHTWTGFVPYSDGSGHDGDYGYAAAGTGSVTSTWTFNVAPGRYQVSATWAAHANRATDAPFTVLDNGSQVATTNLNQEQSPNDFTADGSDWANVAIVDITSSTLQVTLNNLANEFVIADAVRIEPVAAQTVQIVDFGEAGHSGTGFVPYNAGPGYQGGYAFAASGDGSAVSTWTFNVTPGRYRISTTWIEHINRATEATFTIIEDGLQVDQAVVNQEQAPDDFSDSGSNWEDLATIDVTGTSLQIMLTNLADEYVIADAIRIELI